MAHLLECECVNAICEFNGSIQILQGQLNFLQELPCLCVVIIGRREAWAKTNGGRELSHSLREGAGTSLKDECPQYSTA